MFDPQPLSALKTIGVSTITPIGSDGTGGLKILSAAEIRAAGVVYSQTQTDSAIAAAVAAYLPLAGGTLTGPITGTDGLIEQRSGLTAQCFDLFETYTSGTNNGKLRFKATSGGHQIGSARATSGSNRDLLFGHSDAAGAFTTGLTIYASQSLVESTKVYLWESFQSHFALGRNSLIGTNGAPIACGGDFGLAAANSASSTIDTRIRRTAAGEILLVSGNSASTTGANLTLGKLTANGAITPATLTDAAAPNSAVYYSSTQSKLVYKDSGGTVNVLY
jgi:hypothetical protein